MADPLKQALEASEARLRHVVEHAQDLIYYCDTTGRFTYVNPAAARVMKYEERELLGRHFLTLIRADYQKAAAELYERQFAEGIPNTYFEFAALTKTGEIVWIGQHVQLVHEGDAAVGVHAIARDITRQKRAEEQLQALEDQLRRAQRMEAVGRLARGVAHDFNNVLAAITGSADLLALKLPAGHPAHEEAEEIQKAAERGVALTQQLLSFSRRQALPPQELDLAIAVPEMKTLLQRMIGDVVELRVSAAGKTTVRIEPSQLQQVLTNLVVNARDAMPAGGAIDIDVATIEVGDGEGSRYPLPPGRYARLAVRDTGKGIDARIQAQVFEPFVTTKETTKGTGLGLSIVYGIAKDWGGTVTFTTSHRGTTFEVLIPLLIP
jgi:PAS domain S-box-containing protein